MTEPAAQSGWAKLFALAKHLRGPDGCPWDRQQTLKSLAPFLIEESFEVLDATERGRAEDCAEEVGDLGFVLALFLATGEEFGLGSADEILSRTTEKIRRRHPHVFGDHETEDIRELQRTWEAEKAREEHRREAPDSEGREPDDEPDENALRFHLRPPHPALPALAQSRKLQIKAAGLGFDWPDIQPVFEKTHEELDELREAWSRKDTAHVREELGDLLFAVVNLARFLEVEPESALRSANEKFRHRFHSMIDGLQTDGHDPDQASMELLDAYWEKAKRAERVKNAPDSASS